MFIEWTDNLSTGNPIVDTQHRKLIDLIEQLHIAYEAEKPINTQLAILDEFVAYLDIHHKFEEQLFPSEDPTIIDEHMAEHAKIHDLFSDLLKRTRQAGTGFDAQDIADLKLILLDHILEDVRDLT